MGHAEFGGVDMSYDKSPLCNVSLGYDGYIMSLNDATQLALILARAVRKESELGYGKIIYGHTHQTIEIEMGSLPIVIIPEYEKRQFAKYLQHLGAEEVLASSNSMDFKFTEFSEWKELMKGESK